MIAAKLMVGVIPSFLRVLIGEYLPVLCLELSMACLVNFTGLHPFITLRNQCYIRGVTLIIRERTGLWFPL